MQTEIAMDAAGQIADLSKELTKTVATKVSDVAESAKQAIIPQKIVDAEKNIFNKQNISSIKDKLVDCKDKVSGTRKKIIGKEKLSTVKNNLIACKGKISDTCKKIFNKDRIISAKEKVAGFKDKIIDRTKSIFSKIKK